ncbi:mediator of DNA damage checkpoint protein 1 isoform X2 [Melanotaenia boesemani]|uniref:mediator of DNA damage checkpoint protein 1 isoform X2 n=1 Tax=Melanotaenia boesemani TaxID=1250792 RepID=UPI001C04D4C8|nr:mediator of DNA damage checkpoint protein 1 isoform X2 [Melanotaenia boesemani]
MDATQVISDSILESDEEENEEDNQTKRRPPLAKLCVLKNPHIPETELPLFLGDNVLGRDPSTCTLPFPAPSVSKQHATICISVYSRRGCHGDVDMEALVWDLGSMNGTRKGRLKLTPNVRYALSEGDSLVVADIPCQYVSCSTNSVSSQDGTRTPGSRNSGAKARLPDALGEKWGDMSTGSKKCVNSVLKTGVSLKKSPVRGSCLAFEQTPTQPQGTLVPESDSDSDSERCGGGDKKQKTLVSDSDSHKSSPNSSVFFSPTNKIVPESDSESPIMPHISFNTEEPDVDVGGQQLEKKKSPVIERNGEEEDKSEQNVKLKSSISLTREGESLVSTPDVSRKDIPAFNMDSDTDVEGEEEKVASAGPPDTVLFQMDSDTDVDEDKDISEEVPKSISSFNDTKPCHIASVIQPEDITMDNDTDADKDNTALSDAATKAKVPSFHSAHAADSPSSVLPKDIHLDSDTDVDEETEGHCGAVNKDSKPDEAPTKFSIKLVVPEHASTAPHSLHLDSDTDDEVVPVPPICEPSAAAAVTKSRATANANADLDILSDSDTDVDDYSPLAIPVAVTNLPVLPGTSKALKSDSDADTDVDESSVPSAGKRANPADFRVDSDTDVEGEDSDIGKAAEDQMPDLHRENTPGLLVPLLQNCSTPVQVSEGGVEEMETQAFTSPSLCAFRCTVASAVRPAVLSSCSDTEEEEDFIVAETQSFVLPSRHCQTSVDPTKVAALESSGDRSNEQSCQEDSFQLGLSNSSHLQHNSGTLALESTQAFVSMEGGVNLEDTQAYAAISSANRTPAENDSNLEATLAYGEDEEPAGYSEMSKKDSCVNLALEATQAYILETYNNLEDDLDKNKKQNAAMTETQSLDPLTSSTLAMAETQPALSYVGQESLETNSPVCSAQQVKPRTQHETEKKDEQGKVAHLQERHLTETQPMCISNTEESDDEDSFPGPRKKRTAKPLQLDEEQTQPLTCSQAETEPLHITVEPTQPMVLGGDGESDEEESMLVPRKRKAKQHHFEEEQTQQLKNPEVSSAETQPLDSCADDDSELMPGPRKRKAKPLQFEDESQSLTNSVSADEGQPLGTCESGQSDEDDLTPCLKKRKAKPLQFEEEQTQALVSSEVSEVQTQPAVIGEDEASDDDSVPGPRKRKAKQLHLEEEEMQSDTNSEACFESPLKRETAGTSETSVTNLSEMRGRVKEEEEASECSVASKRPTRREGKMLSSTRGRRGEAKSDDASTEEKIQQTKRRRNIRQQENEDERKKLKREKNVVELGQEQEKTEKECRETEDRERLQAEDAEKKQLELKRIEMEKQEKQEILRLKKEKEEKEKLEREEKEKLERERREQKERESLERAKREQEERLEKEAKEHQERLEREEREKLEKRKESKGEEKPTIPARGRRAARRTIAAEGIKELEQDLTSTNDFPSRRTRSRSNSSNSVSSERSALGVNTQESKGKGLGRGAKRSTETPQKTVVRSSRRRTTMAAGQTERSTTDNSAQELLFSSNCSNSVSSDMSSCSANTQNRGRGGRQRGRGRKTEPYPETNAPTINDHDQTSAMRGRNRRKAEESSSEALHEDDKEKALSQQAGTSRGQQQANTADLEYEVSNDKGQSNQGGGVANEKSPLPKRNVRGRGQKAGKTETAEDPVVPKVSDADEARNKRKGRKSELEANKETNSTKVSKGKERARTTEAAEEGRKDETKEKTPDAIQVRKTSRASNIQTKKNAKESLPEKSVRDGEKMEVEMSEKRARGRTSVVQKNKKEAVEESGTSTTSINQNSNVEASEPQTPTSSVSRKRQAPPDSSPVAKTPRSCSASPSANVRLRAGNQAYKVLFTGLVDEAGERVLARLGGSMAKGVSDMNCLVTDKVRRTVKFLCAVAKGIPVVTTDWLEKSGKAGSFLSPYSFIVKDPEQEKKFSFCLQESLRTASSQPLLQGYEIHVTKSVKPEPVHMKDIISSSGATFLPKMPSSHKAQTVVISCEEDWRLCGPAVSASLLVVTAEFILTGILQQKLDFKSHALPPTAADPQPAGGRGKGRRKI